MPSKIKFNRMDIDICAAYDLLVGTKLGSAGDENVSLQDSFKKFRDRKIKERQIMKMCKGGLGCAKSRSEEYKMSLRTKFIDISKNYLGVPYALRFKAEEDPIKPLYLDCCGLVRQVLIDMQEDLGFVIGRWNQAYQMDTLPIILKQEELKPGDLIFYEGTYNSNRSKPQKHGNVHVEIFLGGETGEATIGSRFQRGVVSIFPSFKFKSTTWELVQYHFRSIDTWLDGECRSYCPDHQWISETLSIMAAAGKKSIFANSDDESAGGGDSEDDTTTEDYTGIADKINEDDMIESHIPPIHNGDSTNEKNMLAGPKVSLEEPCNIIEVLHSLEVNTIPKDDQNSKGKATKSKPQATNNNVTISKPKRQTPIRASLTSSSHSNLTNLTAVSAITTTLTEPINEVSTKAIKIGSRRELSTSLDSLSAPKKASLPNTYFVSQSNGWRLVKDALDKRGWQQLPFEYNFSTRFGLKWVERRSQIDYKAHIPGQLVCHIPNNDCITTKVSLLHTMRNHFSKTVAIDSKERKPVPWIPETYHLETPADCVTALEVDDNYRQSNGGINGPLWIYKPASNNRGRGIRVVSGKEDLLEICYGKQTGDPDTSIPPSKGIIQRYIENPLLISPENLKFDIRCYMLIAKTDPGIVAYYHPGYCRLTLKPFTMAPESLQDVTVHLTNAAIQKKDPLYATLKEKQIQLRENLADALDEANKPDNAKFMRTDIDEQIKLCMVDLLTASSPIFHRKHGYFDLLGCDFMVTDDNKLILIEVNTNPALSLDNSTLANLLPGVVDQTIDLVLKAQGPISRSHNYANESNESSASPSLPLIPLFELIFDEENGFKFGASL